MRIAFFDFDGTITTKDTLLEFIKFSKGKTRFYIGFLLNSPWLVAYQVKMISNQKAKERVLTHFFRNTPLPEFQQTCENFAAGPLPNLIRPRALEEIQKLQQAGFEIVIVSASPENWLRTWAAQIGASLIATRLTTTPASPLSSTPQPVPRLTGKIQGTNCHGEEKVRRIKEIYTLTDYKDIYAYGDTSGDRPMLRLGAISFFKPFR